MSNTTQTQNPVGLYLSRARTEEIANIIAQELNFQPGSSLEFLVSELGGNIEVTNPFKTTKGETIHIRGQGDFTIYIPDFTSPNRDRFTVAHELGHYILHSKFGETPMIAHREDHNIAEREANWFAAALLMPKDIFIHKSKEGLSNSELSSYFKVSQQAIEVRKKVLDLD